MIMMGKPGDTFVGCCLSLMVIKPIVQIKPSSILGNLEATVVVSRQRNY